VNQNEKKYYPKPPIHPEPSPHHPPADPPPRFPPKLPGEITGGGTCGIQPKKPKEKKSQD
jgi:hypothetical protein